MVPLTHAVVDEFSRYSKCSLLLASKLQMEGCAFLEAPKLKKAVQVIAKSECCPYRYLHRATSGGLSAT